MSHLDELPIVPSANPELPGSLELGALSISLSVADLAASRDFYERLGFEITGGDAEKDYLILKNGESTIGLFQGMFEENIITFNPGLTNRLERLKSYTDVREIQRHLDGVEIKTVERADDQTTGPAYLTLTDPDGNSILIDQHF